MPSLLKTFKIGIIITPAVAVVMVVHIQGCPGMFETYVCQNGLHRFRAPVRAMGRLDFANKLARPLLPFYIRL